METDAIYFSRRAQEERLAAVNAPHPNAQHAHLQLAERYEEFATAIDPREQSLGHAPAHN